MIAMGAEYGVVHDETEFDWEQAALRQDGVAWVDVECNWSDCTAARCQWRMGARASGSAGCSAKRGATTSQCAGNCPSTNWRASDGTASFANGHGWDLAGNAAHCAGES
jgi:hypothetical protein